MSDYEISDNEISGNRFFSESIGFQDTSKVCKITASRILQLDSDECVNAPTLLSVFCN